MSMSTTNGRETLSLSLEKERNLNLPFAKYDKEKHRNRVILRRLIWLPLWTKMGLVCPIHLRSFHRLNSMLFSNEGTDATIAQHIQTIIDRTYVIERMEGTTKYLVPSTLGIGLIEGYNQMGLVKSVSKPSLRREVSCSMNYTNYALCEVYLDGKENGASL